MGTKWQGFFQTLYSIYSGDTFWLFIKIFREHFCGSIIRLRDLTLLRHPCCRSYVSFETSPTKQSACAQNPTNYRSSMQPGARLCIESVILIKMARVNMVGVNKTNKETFPLRETRSALE